MIENKPITIEINGREFVTTPFQLLQWKHALSLESKGMTLSRGRKVSTHIKKLAGLKRNTSIEEIYGIIADKLEELTNG